MTVEKRKRVSKKNKISWRKHSKIKDVENFLEEQRLEERLGHITFKSDNELFQIDSKLPAEQPVLSKKEKRKRLTERPLKCFSSFQQPINITFIKNARKEAVVKRLKDRLRNNNSLTPSKLQSLKDSKAAIERKKLELQKDKFEDDIWNSENLFPSIDMKSEEWITNDTKKNILRGSGKIRKSLPKITRWKQTVLPSIEVPHPGLSYNPSFEDHQALLKEISDKEQKIIKEEKHLERVTSKMFRKITGKEKEEEWLVEMSENIHPNKNVEESKDESDTNDYKSINPPVVNKKKDPKKRRHQKEEQRLQYALKLARRERKKIADIYKLRQISKTIQKLEQKSEQIKKKREEKKKQRVHEPKRVGTQKYEEPDLEFTDIKDITGNLRTLKKEGNLLVDRLKSLQKRNIIEPTSKQNRKKAKVKKYTKPGHKEDWKNTVSKSKAKRKRVIRK